MIDSDSDSDRVVYLVIGVVWGGVGRKRGERGRREEGV